MLTNRSIPQAGVIPVIPYPDVPVATKWLCEAFGFTPRILMGSHRAQLNVGEAAVGLSEQLASSPQGKSSTLVRVASVDDHYEQACRHGVRILRDPADYPYGERQYQVEDFAGHLWTFSESIADVAPESWGGVAGVL